MINRKNEFDIDYGPLKGVDLNGVKYIYINDKMLGEGLVWNGLKVSLDTSFDVKLNMIKLLLEDLKKDFNLSQDELDEIVKLLNNNKEISKDNNDILNEIKDKIEPKIVYKELVKKVTEYIEVRTTKYIEVSKGQKKPDKVERINTGSLPPSGTEGWTDTGKGYWIKQKGSRKYYKVGNKVLDEDGFMREYKIGPYAFKKPKHWGWYNNH